jgi:glycosyltransferase involved in cell wall biosynthesis
MCLGKPVIVSGAGGVGELLNEGVNGFHIPSKSPEALAEKIIYFCKNPDKINTMGAKSRERIESDFNSERMIGETYQLFRSIVSRQ